MEDWIWDAYAYCYSAKHRCNVGVRTNNRYWKGRYASLGNELLKMLGLPQNTNVVRGFGKCRSNVGIWYEV